MADFRFTKYFEHHVLSRRPYLTNEICIRVVQNSIRSEPREHNRFQFWAAVPELGGRFLRVVMLADKLTIHKAFPDRRFRP